MQHVEMKAWTKYPTPVRARWSEKKNMRMSSEFRATDLFRYRRRRLRRSWVIFFVVTAIVIVVRWRRCWRAWDDRCWLTRADFTRLEGARDDDLQSQLHLCSTYKSKHLFVEFRMNAGQRHLTGTVIVLEQSDVRSPTSVWFVSRQKISWAYDAQCIPIQQFTQSFGTVA